MARRTILLKGDMGHDEMLAVAALKPGHLLEQVSSGKVQKHSVVGGASARLFAKEDALQGRTVDTAYEADDLVSVHTGKPNEWIQARVAAAAIAIVRGDKLVSAGDGTLKKANFTNTRLLYSATAASALITNTTDETAFDKTYSIPANTLRVGDVIRIKGHVTTPSTNSTNTLTLKVKLGSTILLASAAVDVANGDIGAFEVEVIVRTVGASGTIVAIGDIGLGVIGTVGLNPKLLASTAIDTTAAQAVTVTATWSAASESNTVRLDSLSVMADRGSADVPLAIAEEAVDNSEGASEAWIKVRLL